MPLPSKNSQAEPLRRKGWTAESRFLKCRIIRDGVSQTCEEIREKVGVLMFEFSRFWPTDYEYGRDFVADLGHFFSKLPKEWPYAIEIRNKYWLREEYFGCLNRHGITHVFNSWNAMPPVSEQMALAGSRTNPELLRPVFSSSREGNTKTQ
jgi:uncharacterized protein YecE (DUF72 family)